MALYNFSLWTKPYPDITNRIQGSVLDWSGATIITSIIDTTAGHPSRLWSYAGLPYANYKWSLDEIDGSGIIIRNLSNFDAVPSVIDGLLTRDKVQIQVGVALSGLVAGAATALFNGAGGVPDFTGWKIIVFPYGDTRNALIEGLDYTFNQTTLLQGELFAANAWWTFVFVAQTQTQGNSAPTIFDYSTRLMTTTGNILYTDFGNALLIKQIGTYGEYSLPDITTIPVGRPLEVEVGGTGILASKFITYGADIIAFLRGNLIAYPGESFTIVRYQNPDLSNEWRVKFPSGNFARVGDLVNANSIQSGMLLAKLANGDSVSTLTYARLFNEIVIQLPGAQRSTYAAHGTGNNKYLFSAEGTGGDAGKFYLPDYRGLWTASNNTGKAGDFLAALTGEIVVPIPVADTYNGHFGTPTKTGSGNDNPVSVNITVNPGQKSRPDTLLMNQYILI